MTNRIFTLCIAAMIITGCAKEIAPQLETPADNSTEINVRSGETIEISVTLSDVEKIETRASLAENTAGGFTPTWTEGDQILVGGEIFTLVSAQGKTAKFTGKMPEGETFDIIYPAVAKNKTSAQKKDNDFSHLSYSASLKGVNSVEDVHFGYGWAAEHGGTFSQSGYLKLLLNLPAGTKPVKEVNLEAEGNTPCSITVENGALTNNSFTAYLPCEEIKLDKTKLVTITVATEGDEALVNSFFPGTQTLYDSHLILLTTASEKWVRTLSGKGSETDPYLIENLDDFLNIRNIIAANSYTHFKMTANIDMSSVKDWTPINPVNEAYGIIFDGDNHKITGFTCTSSSWASLFGVLHGIVKNLTVENAVISTTSSSPCGIIAAWVGNNNGSLQGRLENVHVINGKVSNSGTTQIGGLTGRSVEGTFLNCSFNGTVERTSTSANDYMPIGGILGEAVMAVSITGCSTSGTLTTASGRACGGILGKTTSQVNIKDCNCTMNIIARDDVAGGIVGYYGSGEVSNCHVAANITVREKGSGSSYVGGIVAHTSGAVAITDCSYKGAIDAFSGIVGGIIGQSNTSTGDGCTLTRCYSEGSIKSTTIVGGVIGRTTDQGFKATDCGTTMDINCSSSYVGGFAGDLPKNSTLKNCFASGSVVGSFGIGGFAGRAFGRQGSSVSLDTSVNTLLEGCIAYNPSVKTCVEGGENPATHYSGGAVVGFSSKPNILKNCWRKASMTFEFYADASLNTLFDHADSSPENPLTQPAGAAKYYSPYHGKAAAAGATLSAVAKAAGWSAEVWDFSTDIPTLKK